MRLYPSVAVALVLHCATALHHPTLLSRAGVAGRSGVLRMIDTTDREYEECIVDAENAAEIDDCSEPREEAWRVARRNLEKQRAAQVMRRRPRFLPFESARQWARAMYFSEEADWREWVEAGEKRNPYVPTHPDTVYANTGWQGWDDFLNGPIETLSDLCRPGYERGRWLKGPLRGGDGAPPDQ